MDRTVQVPISIIAERSGENIDLRWRRDDDLRCRQMDEESKADTFTFWSPDGELFNLVFTIEPNDVSLEFPDDPLDAFWVAKGAAPTERSCERDFEPVSVSEDRRRLLVLNMNHAPARYYYALNFMSELGPIRLITS